MTDCGWSKQSLVFYFSCESVRWSQSHLKPPVQCQHHVAQYNNPQHLLLLMQNTGVKQTIIIQQMRSALLMTSGGDDKLKIIIINN